MKILLLLSLLGFTKLSPAFPINEVVGSANNSQPYTGSAEAGDAVITEAFEFNSSALYTQERSAWLAGLNTVKLGAFGQVASASANSEQSSARSGSLSAVRPPFSGPVAPVCIDVAHGGPKGSPRPRLNMKAAYRAAIVYCNGMIEDKAVMERKGGREPYPMNFRGEAEGGGDMHVVVTYDISACPQDRSMDKNDFVARGLEVCVSDLFTSLRLACSQDPTWAGTYNSDFTLMGGYYKANCAMWYMGGARHHGWS